VDTALAFLRVDHPQVLITGCWANVNASGAAHRMHAHPNNFLSGVYYVQVQDRVDDVQAAVIPGSHRDFASNNVDASYVADVLLKQIRNSQNSLK